MMRLVSFLAAAALAGLAAAPPAHAAESFAAMDLLWVRPAAEPGAPQPCARLLVVNLPRDWMAGDAAAVVLIGADAPAGAAARVVAALLGEGAAVLEFPSRAVEGCPLPAPAPLTDALGALRTLTDNLGAGVVVAIGLGAAGPGVLEAAREEVAARHLDAAGPRLAAAVAMAGPARPVFRAGTPPAAAERWPLRAPRLCAALAPLAGEDAARCAAALLSHPQGVSLSRRQAR